MSVSPLHPLLNPPMTAPVTGGCINGVFYTSTSSTTYPFVVTSSGTSPVWMMPPPQLVAHAKKMLLTYAGDSATVELPGGDSIEVLGDGTVEHSVDGPVLLGDVIRARRGARIELPDGAVVSVDARGLIEVVDGQARVRYKPPAERDFNPYLNSSDLVEEFIRYCGSIGIKQREFGELPINLFLYWLIVRAAERDREGADDVRLMLASAAQEVQAPRCRYCRRFIRRAMEAAGVSFCSGRHMDGYVRRLRDQEQRAVPHAAKAAAGEDEDQERRQVCGPTRPALGANG